MFSDIPSAALTEAARTDLVGRLPSSADLSEIRILWIVDLPLPIARALAVDARKAGVLVNVEDVKELCDFHNVSQIRRGDLLLTVSTGGKSPGLAVRIRQHLERLFGPEWGDRLDRLGTRRAEWQREGKSMEELIRLTNSEIDQAGWLAKRSAP